MSGRVCELVLTSFRNVIITLIHRDSASTQRYFACYPQQALTFLRACTERRKAAERNKKEEDGAEGERTEEEQYV